MILNVILMVTSKRKKVKIKNKISNIEHLTSHSITRDEVIKLIWDVSNSVKEEEWHKVITKDEYYSFLNGISYVVNSLSDRFDLDK